MSVLHNRKLAASFIAVLPLLAGCDAGREMMDPAVGSGSYDLDIDGTPDLHDNCPGVANAPNAGFVPALACAAPNECLDPDDSALLADGRPVPIARNSRGESPVGVFCIDECVIQADNDLDGAGDACDADDDDDRVSDARDDCAFVANTDQANADGDAEGDECDLDDDNDGICDGARAVGGVCDAGPDNCPLVANPDQRDTDGDGEGDACTNDADGDGVVDGADNCPLVANAGQEDLDGDAEGDECDTDDDGDGGLDPVDCAPRDPAIHVGAAEACNGVDDNCDDIVDEGFADADGDGVPDCRDDDRDGDTVLDNGVDGVPGTPDDDNCPDFANRAQTDTDADGLGDVCDYDCDGEGVDETDTLPNHACAWSVDLDGDGFRPPEDCLEGSSAVHPGALEDCNGVDDDCDGVVDNGVLNACGACGPVPAEDCNGVDDDCDGDTDEGVLNACGQCGPVPLEICGNGVDDDCDGVDPACPLVCVDADGDTYGANCAAGLDCDDGDPAVHPGAVEVCNGVDEDCDGVVDEGDDLCPAGQFCLVGSCAVAPAPGQCGGFAVWVAKAPAPAPRVYLEWWTGRGGMVRHGEVDDGLHRSADNECSAVAWDFVPGTCRCYTREGESACRELPASPGVWGCVHNQQP